MSTPAEWQRKAIKMKRLSGSYYKSMILNETFDLPKDNNCQKCGKNTGSYGLYPKITEKGKGKSKKWVCYECK